MVTRDDFKILVKGMKAIYADPKFIPDKDAFDIWYALMKDLEYDYLNMAIQKHMISSKFPPTPADIREQYQSLIEPDELNELEAWNLVSKAIRNSSYNYEEEFLKLPDVVKKAVGDASQLRIWAMDENYNEQVVSSHFIKCYRNESSKDKYLKKMPVQIQSLIKSNSKIIDTNKNSNLIQKSEIELLEQSKECVPMPDEFKSLMNDLRYHS